MNGVRPSEPIRNARVVAVPVAFNEQSAIGHVLDRFLPLGGIDLAVVDDGSTDHTPAIVKQTGAFLLRHSERRGVGAAIRTAYQWASGAGYDICVILSGNDKDRPAEIERLVEPIICGTADLVQGSRYLRGGNHRNMPAYRQLASRHLHPLVFSVAVRGRTAKSVTKMPRLTDTTNGFRALRLSVLDDRRINLDQDWLDQYELEPYLLFKAVQLGYRAVEVPVTKIYPPRGNTYTKMRPVFDWWSILRPILLLGLGLRN